MFSPLPSAGSQKARERIKTTTMDFMPSLEQYDILDCLKNVVVWCLITYDLWLSKGSVYAFARCKDEDLHLQPPIHTFKLQAGMSVTAP